MAEMVIKHEASIIYIHTKCIANNSYIIIVNVYLVIILLCIKTECMYLTYKIHPVLILS